MMLDVRDEGGAVLVMVTLLLVAIFGMTALVIDAGAVLVMRRKVVAAADSASLAAAQSCARGETDGQAQADSVAGSNADGATGPPVAAPNCPLPWGTASATYSASQELFFAPVLGFDDSAPVEASATATWGPSQEARPLPLVLGDFDAANCAGGCPFWLDLGDAADPTGTDAVLARRCRDESFIDWILGTEPSPPVRVDSRLGRCDVTGDEEVENLLVALESLEGDKVFQIADADARRVVGFRPMNVLSADRAVSGRDEDCLPFERSFTAAPPDNTFNIFEDPGVFSCGIPLGATITAEMSKGPDEDWEFVDDVITWMGDEDINNVTVEVSWETPHDALTCENGLREVLGDEICLVLSWQGPRVGGSHPSADATDYGFRAVRLTE